MKCANATKRVVGIPEEVLGDASLEVGFDCDIILKVMLGDIDDSVESQGKTAQSNLVKLH
jgi:hypothetical protein